MAFNRLKRPHRTLMLFPFMDMFFILLLFFFATAAVNDEPQPSAAGGMEGKQVESVPYIAPLSNEGEANVLIQMQSDATLTWLDCKSTTSLRLDQLARHMKRYSDEVVRCGAKEIRIAIRCPYEIPYEQILDVRKLLDTTVSKIPHLKLYYSLLPCRSSIISAKMQSHVADTLMITFGEN